MKRAINETDWIKSLSKKDLLNERSFIIQPVLGFYNDDETKFTIDIEEMEREFQEKLNKLEREV